MNKHVFLSLLFGTAILATASAQSWTLAGNSNATPTSILGTTNAVPLRLFTKNSARLVIDTNGRVAMGLAAPLNRLTVKSSNSSTPAASKWVPFSNTVFAGFGESSIGNSDMILAMASNTFNADGALLFKKARGTLSGPTVVQSSDLVGSIASYGYDGTNFQGAASVDFLVDGTPSAGNVPTRISIRTGSNSSKAERLKIGSSGNFFFNSTQLTLTKASGDITVGTGNLVMGSAEKTIQFALPVASSAPMMTMFPSGTTNYDRMVIAHSSTYPDWGLQYQDSPDKFNFLSAGTPVLTADLGSERVGIGTSSPSTKLDVLGQSRVFSDDPSGTDVTAPFKIENSISSGYYPNLTLFSGFSSKYAQIYGINDNGILVYGAAGYQPVAASAFNVSSDITLKKDITHIKTTEEYEKYLNQIRAIDAITYRYKNEVASTGEKAHDKVLREQPHVGFSAQSLPVAIQAKVPSGPSVKADMKLGYNLSDMAGLTLIGIKALDAKPVTLLTENEELKKANEELKSKLSKQQNQIDAILSKLEDIQSAQQACCNAAASLQSGNQHSANLTSATIDQNIPNPPANNTTRINYSIPAGSVKAELSITDNYGKKVKQITLNNNGKGVLNIDTAGLAPGTYSYTLYVDGRLIETKTMVIIGK